MKIYTRKGDKGETDLRGGKRVYKNHPLIDAIGEIDELNAIIGVIRSLKPFKKTEKVLAEIQHDLFLIGSTIANQKKETVLVISKKVAPSAHQYITPSLRSRVASLRLGLKVEFMEKEMDEMERRLPKLQNFILPAGSTLSCNLHLARTTCRRLERKLVSLGKKIQKEIIPYFNRLSDFFFVLARFENHKRGKKETIWKK